ncbi:c-type cytochrome [Sphingobacterium alkalisoli]|uniref:C-type cytochrome n=1 Tax=Sphingobacterium alkalisoli TaxID=1874115 RepID=A0A4U0GRJ2_9SPHI|nr:PQQ-dependent sugar dehydrogenase [Sphingobacterium alkalisoli]TJY61467.1 c-type cytochrome [Sphingobacterium alkalisoli]GGH30233.1 hypothetical protein GCM10011418_42090 [Sphingobacterium alkalisoli]
MTSTKQIYILHIFCIILTGCTSSNSEEIISSIEVGNSILTLSKVADNLDVPWDLQYDPLNNVIIFSEIAGKIKKLDLRTNEVTSIAHLEDVYQLRTLGLLGMALYQPNKGQHYLYLSYTSKTDKNIYSNLVRYDFKEDKLSNPKTLLQIPGNTGHNGSRIIISKDNKILWATGDAAHDNYAQDTTSLNGKILRLNPDGSIPNDNPIANSYVYAWGFRNIQGLTQSASGSIYTSEHGDAIEDEVNLIHPLHNYGWPQIEGMHDTDKEMAIAKISARTEPIHSWTPVIAPSGMAYYNSTAIPTWKNSLLLVTLKTQSMRILKLSDDGTTIVDENVLFTDYLGRLRSVLVLPNGDIYFSSSNRDWNPQKGFPKKKDDAIYRITKSNHVQGPVIRPKTVRKEIALSGKTLYEAYCSSCHKTDGAGIAHLFPSLRQSPIVLGDDNDLASLLLYGTADKKEKSPYEGKMPAFNFLTDEEIELIANYIRTSFGNTGSKISPQTIQSNRRQNAK